MSVSGTNGTTGDLRTKQPVSGRKYRPWTTGDLARAREVLASGGTWKDVGRALSRDWCAAREGCIRYGVHAPARRPRPEDWSSELRRLYRKGYTDAEIAVAMRVHPATVGVRRRRLGLPKNRAAIRKSQERSWRKHLSRQPGDGPRPSLAALKALRRRVEAAQAGWPGARGVAEVTLLLAVARAGRPVTAAEAAAQAGQPWSANSGHVCRILGRLRAEGFLCRQQGPVQKRRRGGGRSFYYTIHPAWQERARFNVLIARRKEGQE